jgi:5-formyltetrahydrofolate cyclo-ligase
MVQNKSTLRHQLKTLRAGLSPNTRQRLNQMLCDKLLDHLSHLVFDGVCGYMAFGDEADIYPVLAYCLSQDKALYLPRFNTLKQTYDIARVTTLTTDLCTGAFGILEPLQTCPSVATTHIDVWLVPGLGFDTQGHRLGMGRGIYDRLLQDAQGYKIGICYPCQKIDSIPSNHWDIQMDRVIP